MLSASEDKIGIANPLAQAVQPYFCRNVTAREATKADALSKSEVSLPSPPQYLGPKPTSDHRQWAKIPLFWNLNTSEKRENFEGGITIPLHASSFFSIT
jgi:hypothetical protein